VVYDAAENKQWQKVQRPVQKQIPLVACDVKLEYLVMCNIFKEAKSKHNANSKHKVNSTN